MLHIITGRAGCGKTRAVLARMKQEGQARRQLLLVPEQASFETEQRFCRENGNQAGLYGEVLSFTRLENRGLSLAGGGARTVLDEGGRLLVMYAALRSVSGNLSVYAMPSRKPEFLTSLLTTMDELKSCCVTGAQLAQVGEETEGMDGDKLRDLGLIFGAYEAMTARGSLDPRDRLTRLAEKLKDAPLLQGQDIYLDGFTDFTPQQGLVVEQLLRQAHSVTVTLTWGDQPGEEGIFAPAVRTIARLKALAARLHCPVQEETLTGWDGGRTAPLAYLEKNLFARPLRPYEGPWDGSLFVGRCATPREEVQWAAGEIRALLQRGDLRCRDIAVTARSLDRYWEDLEDIFAQYDIPLFQSEMEDILQKPIFTLITAAMDAVNGGYAYEDMFRYLKTGLAGVSLDDCDRLENYVLTWNIWGSRWTQPWTMHPAGYHQTFDEASQREVEALDRLRADLIAPLESLKKKSKDTIGRQAEALYTFLEDIHAPETLEARAAQLLERGEPEQAREMSQLWDIFCGGLEQCAALLGDLELDFGEFARLLRLLLSCYTVGTIPASLDRVTAGDAQRLSNRTCQVLFLLGADDGTIPQVTPGQGLLTDRDRELLEDYGLTLSAQMEERLDREGTIVYTACAKPTRRLYVTWPAAGESGGEKRPAYLVRDLATLFPQSQGSCVPAASPDELRRLAAGLPALRAALAGEEDYAARFRRLDRAAGWTRGRLSPEAVQTLYGERVAMSASRMDQYKSCHFAYFLRYGLKAQERKTAGFHAPEYGTFIHAVLEEVLRAVQARGGVAACSEDEVHAMTEAAVRRYGAAELGGLEHQSPRFRYLFRRLEKSVQAVVDNVIAELRASDFQPIAFELGFGSGKELPPVEVREGGVTLRISGFVDRVDGWAKDGRLYLRVVDYKTGRKSFDLTEVWNGLGLQMLLYLFTLEEKGEQVFGTPPTPAGVLYLPARDAMISGSRDMDEGSRRRLLDRELVRRGLILEDGDVLEAMEHSEGGPRFLPLRVSARTGKITGDALVSAERLGRLKGHTQAILHQICRELAAGNIDADPFWRGPAKNACLYCPYFQACQFEEKRDHRRWIPSVKNSEFWAWLAQREEGGDDHGRAEDT